jgi:hypothetical protein
LPPTQEKALMAIDEQVDKDVRTMCARVIANLELGNAGDLCDTLTLAAGYALGLMARIDPTRAPRICTMKEHDAKRRCDNELS